MLSLNWRLQDAMRLLLKAEADILKSIFSTCFSLTKLKPPYAESWRNEIEQNKSETGRLGRKRQQEKMGREVKLDHYCYKDEKYYLCVIVWFISTTHINYCFISVFLAQ